MKREPARPTVGPRASAKRVTVTANSLIARMLKRAGISDDQISNLLRATGNPTVKTLARVAHALGYHLRVTFQPVSDRGGTLHPDARRPRSTDAVDLRRKRRPASPRRGRRA